jgi:2-aminoethylphosphonate-pyruvate transaminase
MSERPTAVILAAGLGTRLGELAGGAPKGLLVIGGETLVGRQIRLLEARRIRRVVLVTGHAADAYERFLAARTGPAAVECVHNPRFATTGSMASLAIGLARVRRGHAHVIVLESDLFFEERALDAILAAGGADDRILASDLTGATDEVWVEESAHGSLIGLSKVRGQLDRVDGEFVGISRVGNALAHRLIALYEAFALRQGHGRMAYDTDALAAAARATRIEVVHAPGLAWGEIDFAAHLARVLRVVEPACRRRAAAPAQHDGTRPPSTTA